MHRCVALVAREDFEGFRELVRGLSDSEREALVLVLADRIAMREALADGGADHLAASLGRLALREDAAAEGIRLAALGGADEPPSRLGGGLRLVGGAEDDG